MEELQDGDEGLEKHLDSEEGWESWKNGRTQLVFK